MLDMDKQELEEKQAIADRLNQTESETFQPGDGSASSTNDRTV
jgi:hypothetical protein